MIHELASQMSQLGLNNKSLGVLERNGFKGDSPYIESEDERIIDQFGPWNNECITLPKQIKVTFVDQEE